MVRSLRKTVGRVLGEAEQSYRMTLQFSPWVHAQGSESLRRHGNVDREAQSSTLHDGRNPRTEKWGSGGDDSATARGADARHSVGGRRRRHVQRAKPVTKGHMLPDPTCMKKPRTGKPSWKVDDGLLGEGGEWMMTSM